MTTIDLRGNIRLQGFEELDVTELLVVKNMVGRYASAFAGVSGFSQLVVTQAVDGTILATAAVDGTSYHGQSSSENLYIALDEALKMLVCRVQDNAEPPTRAPRRIA